MSNEPQQPRPDYRSGATGGEGAPAPREQGSAGARGAGEQGWAQNQGQQGYIPNQGAPRYSQPQGGQQAGQPQGDPRYAQNAGGQGRPQGDPRHAQNAGGGPYAQHPGYAQQPGGYQGDPRYAQQPGGYPAGARGPQDDEKTVAVLTHLSSPIAAIISVGWLSFLGPLIVWFIYKDKSPFLRQAAAGAFNFNVSLWLLNLIGWICVFTVVLSPLGFLLIAAYWIMLFVFHIIAAVKAGGGKAYRYPMQLPILR
ncbi:MULTISPECIES: DUF4870 domain-containing protein [Kocuria]|uniref:DUF4870 domain-containing protein n=1 Tax=Kocuria TaxID=57493 RepID=UPI0021A50957|nr:MULTISPECIES: DUF4870 domain-containing protein [Kocuria]MCT1544670.1 DUF4870 domain-containing protein [Kocuria rhizophila]MCT2171309.1 DUF4870 domain-containing protein [Kocuria rhizophila]MDN3462340.1 DUF4870 domain-containing protein [Kocuria sp. APC 4018]